jgi:hypothetical protein
MLKKIALLSVSTASIFGSSEIDIASVEPKEQGYYEVNHLDVSNGKPTVSHVTLIPMSAAVRTTLEIASVINFSVYRLKDTPLVAQHGFYVNGVQHQLNLLFKLVSINLEDEHNRYTITANLNVEGAVIKRNNREGRSFEDVPLIFTINNNARFNLVDFGLPTEDVLPPLLYIEWNDSSRAPIVLKWNIGRGKGGGSIKADIAEDESARGSITAYDGIVQYWEDGNLDKFTVDFIFRTEAGS